VKHQIRHKRRKKTVESTIGIKLTPELAKQKGVCIYGEDYPDKCEDQDQDQDQDQDKGKGKKK
jgi:hypothetical protein